MIAFLLLVEDDEQRELLIEIYKKYFALIKKRLAGAVPVENVEDCIQDCFVRLVNNVKRLQELSQAQITVYVNQTIRSVIVDYQKKKVAND